MVRLEPQSPAADAARARRARLLEALSEQPEEPSAGEEPLAANPQDPPQVEPRPGGATASRPEDPSPPRAEGRGFLLWLAVAKAYDDEDLPALKLAIEALQAAEPEAHYSAAALGLQAFLAEDFAGARDLLAPLERDPELAKAAEEAHLWRPQRALVRAAFYSKDYELARAVALRFSDQQRAIWLLLIDGPFAAEFPLTAPGLTSFSPEGNYRVLSNVGITAAELTKLERELRAQDPPKRARVQDKIRKGHKLLGTLGEVLDKAYLAYNKLLQAERRKEVYPSVYVFRDREGFANFGRAIGIGSTENALGYYMPSYRILVFYEQTEDVKLGLSRDTVETLLHEAFHQWMHLQMDDAPAWLNEGMAEYFSIGAKIGRRSLEYAVVPERYPSRLSNIRDALKGVFDPPWGARRLLRADHSTFMTAGQAAVNYAHAWSLVHYLGATKPRRKLLVSYFQALRGGATRLEAFDQVFGALDLDALDADWKRYVLALK